MGKEATAHAEMSAEQEARNMLERMGIEDAQSWSAGELGELASLIGARGPRLPTQEGARIVSNAEGLSIEAGHDFHIPGEDQATVEAWIKANCLVVTREWIAAQRPMTEARAREILGKAVQPDGSLLGRTERLGVWLGWSPGDELCIIGDYEHEHVTAEQLEAIAWWMRSHATSA